MMLSNMESEISSHSHEEDSSNGSSFHHLRQSNTGRGRFIDIAVYARSTKQQVHLGPCVYLFVSQTQLSPTKVLLFIASNHSMPEIRLLDSVSDNG